MKFLSQINVNTEYTLPIVDGNNGQVLTTDGNGAVYWGSVSAGVTNLDGLTDVILTSPSSGQLLRYGIPPGSGEANPVWYNFTPNYLTPSSSIDNLGDVTITTATTGQILQWNGTAWVNATLSTVEYVSKVQHLVKCGVAVTKGQAVYVTTSDGTNMIVGLASNATEATSSKVIGIAASSGAINDQIFVVTEGLIAGLNTLGTTAGDPVWLGTNGNLLFGLANKPVAPANLVYLGVVTRVQQNNGEIFVNVQNGFELNELHDVLINGVTAGQLLRRDSDGLWKNWTPNYLTSLPTHNHDDRYYTESEIAGFFGGELEIAGYNATNWDTAYNDKINSASFSTSTGVLTLTQQDSGTITVDLDGRYLESLPSHTHAASDITSGTLSTDRLPKQELGISIQGNFGQWEPHGTYTNLNTDVAYWGWSFVQGNTNAPHSGSQQWYRGRFSLGDAYGNGSAGGDYWMEIAIPRYNQGSNSGNLFVRTCENGTINGWQGVRAAFATDADTLDGQHGSYYQPASSAITTSNISSQDVRSSRYLTNYSLNTSDAFQAWNLYETGTADLNPTADNWWYGMRVSHGDAVAYYSYTLATNFFSDDIRFRRVQGGVKQAWRTIFHTGNFTDNSTNWNTAYGWGNHATQGYATQTWVGLNYYNEGEIDDFFSGAEAISGYNKSNWDTAYNDRITAAAVTGTSTKTLTLTQGDGGTVTATWTDYDTDNDAQVLTWTAPSKELAISNGNSITLDGLATEDYVLSQGFTTFQPWNSGTGSINYTAGKVGVGTASPQKVLEVISGANNFVSVGVDQLGVGQWSGIHFGYRESNANYRKSAIVFERTDLTANDAQGKIHILNGPQGNSNSATLSDARLTIAENGSVGIGTPSPGARLHVVGNTYIQSGVLFVDNIAGYATNLVSIAANTNFTVPSGIITVAKDLGTNDYANVGQHNMQLRIRKASLDGGCAPRSLELGVLDNGTGIIQANHCGIGYNTLSLNPVAGSVLINGQTAWHAGNDGASSGLDADLLDGIDSARFIYGQSGNRRGTNLISNWNQTDFPDVAFLSAENGGTNAPTGDYTYGTQYSFHRDGAAYRTQLVTALYSDTSIYVRNSRDSDVWNSWKRLWHSGDFSSTNISNWNAAYNDRITAVAVSGTGTKTLTLTQQDGGTLTATWTDYDTDNDAQTLSWDQGQTLLSISGGNDITLTGLATEDYVNSQGFVTSSGTVAGVVRTVTGTNSAELVRGNMGDNDQARILVGATASNAGYLEIATADDGTEPIYVRQYTGTFVTEARTATLLDGSGNTTFPGTVTAGRYRGHNSIILNNYTTVNPSSNVFLYSQPNDRDAWIFLDSADTGSNWGIYHRQIDSAVGDIPGNSIGFVGGGSSTLQGYINLSNGDAYFRGNLTIGGTLTENSSIRFKENIQPLEPALAKVEQLNPVTYTKITSQEEEIGLIAEEVAELFPEVVTYNESGQPQGIQYQRLSVILLKAVQELTERVNKLENK